MNSAFTCVPCVPKGQALKDKKYETDLLLEKKRDNKESNIWCKVQPTSSTLNGQNNRQSNTFKGKAFCFSSSFPVDRRAEIIDWVKQGGGVMVDDKARMNASFVIECHGLLQIPADSAQCTIISTHWIRSCLEEGCIQDIDGHVLYSPLRCHIPLPGFEGLRFSVSQYEQKERLLLKNLCFTLGAKFTERLTKKVTHLLCKFTSGSKYEAACKWGIQSVTADWITECITQDMIVALDQFRPKPATAQDREAGFCTQTQYPTQAAFMGSGYVPSQLPSEVEGPGHNSDQHTDCRKVLRGSSYEEAIHSSTNGKRSRLSECDITSKKNGKPNDVVRDTDADISVVEATGVVEAIDFLIAQSNEVQDTKSPERSSNQIIFSPDHSILGHNHANSHSTFAISRHWLGRTEKQDSILNPAGQDRNPSAYDAFSETQTDSQVVGYEEDLSGRQKIIDRVRSQSMTLTPDT